MLAVMLLASCVAPRAKLAFSWLPWFSWYSAGIGIKAFRPPTTRILLADTSHLSTAVNTTRCHSIVFVCPLDRPRGEKIAVSLLYYGPVALGTAPRSRLQRYLRNTGPILADAYKEVASFDSPALTDSPGSRVRYRDEHRPVAVASVHTGHTAIFIYASGLHIRPSDIPLLPAPLYRSSWFTRSFPPDPRAFETPPGRHTIPGYRAPFLASFRPAVWIYLGDSWAENARSGRHNPVTEYHKTRPRVGYY